MDSKPAETFMKILITKSSSLASLGSLVVFSAPLIIRWLRGSNQRRASMPPSVGYAHVHVEKSKRKQLSSLVSAVMLLLQLVSCEKEGAHSLSAVGMLALSDTRHHADGMGLQSSWQDQSEVEEGRRRLTTDVSTWSELKSAITNDVNINIVNDITFTGNILISSITGLAIGSSNGAVLTSDRSYEVSWGGLFDIEAQSDVTFTGLGFARGRAELNGGCVNIQDSKITLHDAHFTSCYAVVSGVWWPLFSHLNHRSYRDSMITHTYTIFT